MFSHYNYDGLVPKNCMLAIILIPINQIEIQISYNCANWSNLYGPKKEKERRIKIKSVLVTVQWFPSALVIVLKM